MTCSNLLTVARIVCVPPIVCAIIYARWTIALGLLILAGLTDVLDGYLARLLKQETRLGKLLDPVADKTLLLSCFSALAWVRPPGLVVPIWFVWLLLMREITIVLGSIFVVWFAQRRHGAQPELGPTIWGKLTTFFQLLFIGWLLMCYFFSWVPAKTYGITLAGIVCLSVASFIQYVRIGIGYMRQANR